MPIQCIVQRIARLARPCTLGAIAGMAGCALPFFLTDPDTSKTVPAEYNKIGDRKLAVVVWADQSTMDEFSSARFQVSRAVTHFLRKHLEKARFVSARKVRALQADPQDDWERLTPCQIADKLKCDLVLRLDLLDFTMRASDTPQLRKARIRATLNLYDCDSGGAEAVYSDETRIIYPPGSLHGKQGITETDLLHQAVDYFAEATARKFYAHEVKLQDRPAD